jgi:hypothetical protein
VIFLGVPTSTFSGTNLAPEVARLKGQKEATHLASISKKCM